MSDLILNFSSSPEVLLDETLDIRVSNGVLTVEYTETFKAIRNTINTVTLPSPYSNSQTSANYVVALDLDYYQTHIPPPFKVLFNGASLTFIITDTDWSFLPPTGTTIDNGSVTYSLANNVSIASYSANATDPINFFDFSLIISGGSNLYDVYVDNNLILEDQTSPISVTSFRSIKSNINIVDSLGVNIGSVETENTTLLTEDDINIVLNQNGSNVNITVNHDIFSSVLSDFNYSLDDITYQLSNVFLDKPTGVYTVYVKDALNGITEKSFTTGEGLVYFSEYRDVKNVLHELEMYKQGFLDTPTEITADYSINYPDEKDAQEAIKPLRLKVNLLSSDDLSFNDLYTEEERTIRVVYKRNNVTLFNGWLSADGLYESFVYNKWYLELDCIDGLGYLKDLSYVDNDTGLTYAGKQSGLEIITNCLKRTNLTNGFRTSINIYYTGLSGVDVLDNVYFNTDRFIKEDGETIMDCENVLRSILEIFNASICFFEGYWYIYRSNEIYNDSAIAFYNYDSDGSLVSGQNQLQKNIAFSVGSQIDGYYPHHVNANQKKSLERALGIYRLNLEYGRVFPYYENNSLIWNDATSIDDWVINRPTEVESRDDRGFWISRPQNDIFPVVTTDDYTVSGNPRIQLSFDTENINSNDDFTFQLIIKIKYTKGSNVYWLQPDLTWGSVDNIIFGNKVPKFTTDTFNIVSQEVPELDGVLNNLIHNPKIEFKGTSQIGSGFKIFVKGVRVSTYTGEDSPKGKNYTIEKIVNPVPSVDKDVKKVYNGDVLDGTYYSTIYKNDEVTETSTWNKIGVSEEKELLVLMIEDRLRMNYSHKSIFEGDYFGYVPYFSVLSINNVNGKFIPIEYNYDAKTNITTIKAKEILNTNFADSQVIYTINEEYGNVVKPTIKG